MNNKESSDAQRESGDEKNAQTGPKEVLASYGYHPLRYDEDEQLYYYNCMLPPHYDCDGSLEVDERSGSFNCRGCGRTGDTDDLLRIHAMVPVGGIPGFASFGGNLLGTGSGTSLAPEPLEPSAAEGCTLEQVAAAKGLPVPFLVGCGWSDFYYCSRPAVRIPYLGLGGEEASVRFRTALSGDCRFCWRKGNKVMLYGLNQLGRAIEAGYLVLVEGETDAATLWYHNIPALGIPGAATWRGEWEGLLSAVPSIYAVIEPDQGGKTLLGALSHASFRERLRFISLAAGQDGVSPALKDVNDLHCSDPAMFAHRFGTLMDASLSVEQARKVLLQMKARDAYPLCEELSHDESILDRAFQLAASRGLAGEETNFKLLFLALTTRLLARPVCVVVKGPSSAGKSFLVERVRDLFPASAYYTLSAMSERALLYLNEPLEHRFLVLNEVAGADSDFTWAILRTLISEGYLRYATVMSSQRGPEPLVIEKPGPTGFLATTTLSSVEAEMETRVLSLRVSDTPTQTRAILLATASREGSTSTEDGRPDEELPRWQALQEWLEGQDCSFVIPFATTLATLSRPAAVRFRRDFSTLLRLVAAHALLHRANRERDERGRVIATVWQDYAPVRALVVAPMAQGVQCSVSFEVLEVVEAVRILLGRGREQVTVQEVAREVGIDRDAAKGRVTTAVRLGYLKNTAPRGKSYELEVGESLPREEELLPTPEQLEESWTRESATTPPALGLPPLDAFRLTTALTPASWLPPGGPNGD